MKEEMTIQDLDNKIHSIWQDIVKRTTHGSYSQSKNTSYKDCILCDEWKDFSNFLLWYKSQIGFDRCYEVDKDLLVKGNKLYSPHTCILLPKFLNSLLLNSKSARGDLPLGVTYAKNTKNYVARCRYVENGERKRKTIGYYPTPELAFLAYKTFKEAYIKEQARQYKEDIPQTAYDALCAFEVKIED